MEKYNKLSSKMYNHLLQQIVQQKLHNNHVALLIKEFVFTRLVESLY